MEGYTSQVDSGGISRSRNVLVVSAWTQTEGLRMNRRGFIGALAAFASGAILDPEKLLWVRGAKTISIPAPQPRTAYRESYREFAPIWLEDSLKASVLWKRILEQEGGAIATRPVRVPFQSLTGLRHFR